MKLKGKKMQKKKPMTSTIVENDVLPVNLVLGDLKIAENLGQGFLFLKNLILTCFFIQNT
jgi:hypothetical protein